MPLAPRSMLLLPQCPIPPVGVVRWRSCGRASARTRQSPAHPQTGPTTTAGTPVFSPANSQSPARVPNQAVCSNYQISRRARCISSLRPHLFPQDLKNFSESCRPVRESGCRSRSVYCPLRQHQEVCDRCRGQHKHQLLPAARRNPPSRSHPRRSAARTSLANEPPHIPALLLPGFLVPARTARTPPHPGPEPAPLVLSRKRPRSTCFSARRKVCIASAKIRTRALQVAHAVLLSARSSARECTNSTLNAQCSMLNVQSSSELKVGR